MTIALFLIDTLEVGGTEQSTLELTQRFRRIRPIVVSLYCGDALRSKFEAAGVDVVALGLTGKYSWARAIRRVSAVVDEVQPALIHASLFRAGVVARIVARRRGIPLVDTLVNDSYSAERWRGLSLVSRAKLFGVLAADRMTVRWATHVIANSRAVGAAGIVALGLPSERVSVVHRGRDPALFARHQNQTTLLRARLQLTERDPLLVNVARLIPRKGQAEMLAALPIVRSRRPNAHMVIAGEGPERASLADYARRLGIESSVTLLGRCDDVPSLLGAANLFVFPSHYEGHPGALIEAALAGTPIVARDTPSNREVVTDRVTGRLYRGGSSELAHALLAALDDHDKTSAMAAEGQRQARQRFDIDRQAERYEAELERILERTLASRGSTP